MQCSSIIRTNHRKCVNKGTIHHNGIFVCGLHAKLLKHNEDCCICLHPLTPISNVKVLYCKHIIHKTCYNDLITRLILKCPLCRTKLKGVKIQETITIHVNSEYKTFYIKDLLCCSITKEVMKRNRKYRPNFIMSTLTNKLRRCDTTPFTNAQDLDTFIHINISGFDSFSIQFEYFPVLLKHMTFDKSALEIIDVVVSLLTNLEHVINET